MHTCCQHANDDQSSHWFLRFSREPSPPESTQPTGGASYGAAARVIRRNSMIAAAIATHPYSTSITQPGSAPHGRPSARKCHCTYVGTILTVQTIISSVPAEVKNGSSQSRYQGKTAGANTRHAAIGQANSEPCTTLRLCSEQLSRRESGRGSATVLPLCGSASSVVKLGWSGDRLDSLLLIQAAVTSPASTARPASNCGGAT